MKLYIDTTDAEEIIIKVGDQEYQTKARENKSQKLLAFIEESLKKSGKDLSDISEIEVNTGPGSYTGIRVGASVAQALAWSLGIKVNNKNIREDEQLKIEYN